MWWPFRSRRALPDPSPDVRERLSSVETDVRALRRDLDDLDDTLRAWRGREDKRAARERAKAGEEEPTAVHAPHAPFVNGAPSTSVHALRAGGRWPFK